MKAESTTLPRRSTPPCASGYSVVGLLVAMTVTLAVTAAALSMALSGRRLYESDQRRTTVNQSLRAGVDLLGLDIQRAGQRLPADCPAIEIEDGAAGAPDRLILRRNLIDAVLPVCADILAGGASTDVAVADTVAPVPAGCNPSPDADADGWPDDLEAWRDYRVAEGGAVPAFLWNPTSRVGEFFLYDAEDNVNHTLHKANADLWQFAYGVADQARVYLLEQRAFSLNGELLECVLNEDVTTAVNLVGTLSDFQVRATLQDGTVLDALGPLDDWTGLRSLEISLEGQASGQNRTLRRRLTTEFAPRNVLSFGRAS